MTARPRAGQTVLTTKTSAQQAYQYLLDHLSAGVRGLPNFLANYWSVSQVSYQQGSGDLVPAAVSNPVSVLGLREQRVAIARALVNTPHLLLADEPTGNLDSQTATGILDLLTRLRHENQMTILIATHDPQIAARCDRLIRLRDGTITDDIEIADGHPVDETIRKVGQLG